MPFAGYSDFAECVAQNSDKGDPNAYCGKIKHQVEGKSEQGHGFDELPEGARKTWFDALQAAMMKNDEETAGRAAWATVYRQWFKGPAGWAPLKAFENLEFKAIWKADRIVYGTASLEMVDKDGQVFTADALQNAFRSYLDRGHVLFWHKNIPVGEVLPSYKSVDGTLFESGVHGKALDVVVRIYKDTKMAEDVWKEIEEGRLRAFSVGGQVLGDTVKVHGPQGTYERVDKLDLHEISIVPNPANEASYFTIIKSAIKEGEKIPELTTPETAKAPYPWDECIADQRASGADDPEAVCAAIKNRTVAHSLSLKMAKDETEARAQVREWMKHPFAKYWVAKVRALEALVRDEKMVALNCKNFTEKAIAIIENKAYHQGDCPEGEHMVDDECVPMAEKTEPKVEPPPIEPTLIVKAAEIEKLTAKIEELSARIHPAIVPEPKPAEAPKAPTPVSVPTPTPAPPAELIPPPAPVVTSPPAAPSEKKSVVPEETKGQPEPDIDWSKPSWGPGDSAADILKKMRGK